MRCLIIDDNEDFLVSAQRLLETQGIRVVGTASSADEAVRMLDALEPDVALVDVELGEEDGIALADALVERAPATGVVLISSHDRSELSELLEASRAAGFVPKTDLGAPAIYSILG